VSIPILKNLSGHNELDSTITTHTLRFGSALFDAIIALTQREMDAEHNRKA